MVGQEIVEARNNETGAPEIDQASDSCRLIRAIRFSLATPPSGWSKLRPILLSLVVVHVGISPSQISIQSSQRYAKSTFLLAPQNKSPFAQYSSTNNLDIGSFCSPNRRLNYPTLRAALRFRGANKKVDFAYLWERLNGNLARRDSYVHPQLATTISVLSSPTTGGVARLKRIARDEPARIGA